MASIILDSVHLRFALYRNYNRSIKKTITKIIKKNSIYFPETKFVNAINGITLSIDTGSRIGIVGHNGAGKTTLLKLISGLYPPTQGKVTVKGKIASIANVSLGMNKDLTGYENIINKGILLGLTLSEIKSKLEHIMEISELGDRLFHPMFTYSLGMSMRLAIAIAISVDADILLIDEAFNALDAGFTQRNHKVLQKRINKTEIVIMVSHSLDIIKQYCNQVLWLQGGKIKDFGNTHDIVDQYSKEMTTV